MNVTVLKMHSAGTMELVTQKIQMRNLYTPVVWYIGVEYCNMCKLFTHTCWVHKICGLILIRSIHLFIHGGTIIYCACKYCGMY